MSILAEAHLAGFLEALHTTGVPVLPPRRVDFLRALSLAPPGSIDALYWAARVTLVSGVEQIERFDIVFDAWFRVGLLEQDVGNEQDDQKGETERPGGGEGLGLGTADRGEGTGRAASTDEVLNRRAIAAATPKARSVWSRTVEATRRSIPRTGGRRHARGRAGQLDLRRTLAAAMRNGGEIVVFRHRHRPPRMRRVLLLIDVSGSLKAHSPEFLRFAHAVVHGAERVEVFTFGTRLTRITPALGHPDVDEALAGLSSVIRDFDGGTRIGESLLRLLANSRFIALARGAVVIVLSDGLERGDPGPMAAAVERLARLGHRLIWLTPMMGDPAYRPATRGMRAILGSLDHLGDGSTAEALLAELCSLPARERRPRRRATDAWRERRRSA